MGQRYRHLSLAVPALAERDRLPALIEALCRQTCKEFTLYCCVNNCEGWGESASEVERMQYEDNQSSLAFLRSLPDLPLVILDRSSRGRGWQGKRHGVGWARKELFDCIISRCDENELIVSLDADTLFADTYLECLLDAMNSHPDCCALAVPYSHPLCGDDLLDRAMLRYELYMRHYLISLMEIGNPYAFSALGSAMVFPLWAYHRVGGITPLQGGEDFYLMQKFAKCGPLLRWCEASVRPAGRASARVPFGTGPAIAKGVEAMSTAYPFYPHSAFEAVGETYALFPALYDAEQETPMSAFLREQLRSDALWQPLRNNFKTLPLFVRACRERVDGLRILQFLRSFREGQLLEETTVGEEEEFCNFCNRHGVVLPAGFSFQQSEVRLIEGVRNAIRDLEWRLRRQQSLSDISLL